MNAARGNVEQFETEGYCVFQKVIPEEQLQLLEENCALYLTRQMADMDRVQADVLGLSQRGRRYFLSYRHDGDPAMRRVLFGEPIASIVSALIGKDAFLFLELFVVKPQRTGMAFGWHQDSGYLLGTEHRPYLSLWCALDDATAENGALHVLPYDRAGTREVVAHHKERGTADFVGYQGDDPGVVVSVPRGSIVALSSTTFHRSGPNVTEAPRRAFLASYSAEPITNAKGGLWNQAVPFLRGGENVFEESGENSGYDLWP